MKCKKNGEQYARRHTFVLEGRVGATEREGMLNKSQHRPDREEIGIELVICWSTRNSDTRKHNIVPLESGVIAH